MLECISADLPVFDLPTELIDEPDFPLHRHLNQNGTGLKDTVPLTHEWVDCDVSLARSHPPRSFLGSNVGEAPLPRAARSGHYTVSDPVMKGSFRVSRAVGESPNASRHGRGAGWWRKHAV